MRETKIRHIPWDPNFDPMFAYKEEIAQQQGKLTASMIMRAKKKLMRERLDVEHKFQ